MFLVESRILDFGIWNTYQGIWIPLTNYCNPESSTWNPEYTAYNPESRNVLDSHMWDEVLFSQFQVKRDIRTRWKTQLTSFPQNLTLPYEYNKTLFLKFKGKAIFNSHNFT